MLDVKDLAEGMISVKYCILKHFGRTILQFNSFSYLLLEKFN